MTDAPTDADPLAFVRGVFRSAPFVAGLGIEPRSIAPGRCESVLALRPDHLQHTGQAHAGVLTTLADHTAGAAAQTLVRGDGVILTAELKISLLRPAQGERLVCIAQVVKAGRQLMFTEAEVLCERDGQSVTVARLSATMAVARPRD